MRNFNYGLIAICSGITFLDFIYIPLPKENHLVSPYVVPIVLTVLFAWSFLSSDKNPKINFHKIVLSYCLFSAGFIGLLAPFCMFVFWASSNSSELDPASIYGQAALIQFLSGLIFGLVGWFSFIKLKHLYART